MLIHIQLFVYTEYIGAQRSFHPTVKRKQQKLL